MHEVLHVFAPPCLNVEGIGRGMAQLIEPVPKCRRWHRGRDQYPRINLGSDEIRKFCYDFGLFYCFRMLTLENPMTSRRLHCWNVDWQFRANVSAPIAWSRSMPYAEESKGVDYGLGEFFKLERRDSMPGNAGRVC